QITVTGTITDTNTITVTVNDIAATLTGTEFSATVPLEIGANTLTVKVVDAAGNIKETTQTITRQNTEPLQLSVTEPAEGSLLNSNPVLFAGNVTGSNGSATTVTVLDKTFSVSPEGTFGGYVDLRQGSNVVPIVATDATGRRSEVIRNVTLDAFAPVFQNVTPADGSLIAANSVVVRGTIEDDQPVTLFINGTQTDLVSGAFVSAVIPIQEQIENSIRLVAIDEAGNEATRYLKLIGKDLTPPVPPTIFPVVSPTRLGTQTIAGRAEPGTAIAINGGTSPVSVRASSGGGFFLASIPLAEGLNQLQAVATDAAGNVSTTASFAMTRNALLPPPPPGQAWQINVGTGDAQHGLVKMELPRPLVVYVSDTAGSPVAGAPVTFSVLQGSGQFADGQHTLATTTNSQGYATARYVAGDLPGTDVVRADFAGNTAVPTQFFATIYRPIPGGTTQFLGLVLDQNLRALPNVLVRLAGQQTRTDDKGYFQFQNVPSGPHQLLELIGRDQIQLPGRWPNISYDVDILPGIDNRIDRPLFLPKVNEGIEFPLDQNNVVTEDTTYELPVVGGQPPIRVTARAGTQINFPPDVSDRRFSVTRIAANRIPMALENGLTTNLYVSVQPSGAIFDPPLEVEFPNLDGLAPNSPVLLMSFDHDAGRYVQAGTGTVDETGQIVRGNPGSGIRVGAWHAFPPTAPPPDGWLQAANPSSVSIEDPVPCYPSPLRYSCTPPFGTNLVTCDDDLCWMRGVGVGNFETVCQQVFTINLNDDNYITDANLLAIRYGTWGAANDQGQMIGVLIESIANPRRSMIKLYRFKSDGAQHDVKTILLPELPPPSARTTKFEISRDFRFVNFYGPANNNDQFVVFTTEDQRKGDDFERHTSKVRIYTSGGALVQCVDNTVPTQSSTRDEIDIVSFVSDCDGNPDSNNGINLADCDRTEKIGTRIGDFRTVMANNREYASIIPSNLRIDKKFAATQVYFIRGLEVFNPNTPMLNLKRVGFRNAENGGDGKPVGGDTIERANVATGDLTFPDSTTKPGLIVLSKSFLLVFDPIAGELVRTRVVSDNGIRGPKGPNGEPPPTEPISANDFTPLFDMPVAYSGNIIGPKVVSGKFTAPTDSNGVEIFNTPQGRRYGMMRLFNKTLFVAAHSLPNVINNTRPSCDGTRSDIVGPFNSIYTSYSSFFAGGLFLPGGWSGKPFPEELGVCENQTLGQYARDERQRNHLFFRYATNRSNITRYFFTKKAVFFNNLKEDRGSNPMLVAGTPVNGIIEGNDENGVPTTLMFVNDAPHPKLGNNPTLPDEIDNIPFVRIKVLDANTGKMVSNVTAQGILANEKAVALDVLKLEDLYVLAWAGIDGKPGNYANGHLEVLKYLTGNFEKVNPTTTADFENPGWEPVLTSYYSLDRNFTTNRFRDDLGVDQVPNVILQATVDTTSTFLTFKPDSTDSRLQLAGFSPTSTKKIYDLGVRCPAKIIGTVDNLNLKLPNGVSVSPGSTFVLLENNGLISFLRLSPKGTSTYVGH
ncbi:MAG TPA: hypothetical protein PLB32_06085, partial [Acidobacteriota bacterium]|nr:hypothetical protein [Acidobacteriota bacterium]